MKLYLDTADIEQIREINAWGVLDGVTTNPTLLAKMATGERTWIEMAQEICREVDGPVSLEVVATDAATMITEGIDRAKLADNVYVKLPCTPDGLEACKALRADGIRVNMTLVFSPSQSLLAAKAGANLISPFLGRLDDASNDGLDQLAAMIEINRNFGFESEILAASLRHPMHVVEAARLGSDIATMPYDVFKKLVKHPLTDRGLDQFLADWEQAKEALGA